MMLNEYKKLSLLRLNLQWMILLQSMAEIWLPQTLCHQGPKTYRILECTVGSFRLDYFLLTEDIILEPVMRSGSNYSNNYKGNPITNCWAWGGLIIYATTTLRPITSSNSPPQLWFPVQWHTSQTFNTSPGHTITIFFIMTQHYNWNDSTREIDWMINNGIISINDNGYQRILWNLWSTGNLYRNIKFFTGLNMSNY